MNNSENYIRTINWAICFAGSEKSLKMFLLQEIKKISLEKYIKLKEADNVLLKKELESLVLN
jgi:hypothetical protein